MTTNLRLESLKYIQRITLSPHAVIHIFDLILEREKKNPKWLHVLSLADKSKRFNFPVVISLPNFRESKLRIPKFNPRNDNENKQTKKYSDKPSWKKVRQRQSGHHKMIETNYFYEFFDKTRGPNENSMDSAVHKSSVNSNAHSIFHENCLRRWEVQIGIVSQEVVGKKKNSSKSLTLIKACCYKRQNRVYSKLEFY